MKLVDDGEARLRQLDAAAAKEWKETQGKLKRLHVGDIQARRCAVAPASFPTPVHSTCHDGLAQPSLLHVMLADVP